MLFFESGAIDPINYDSTLREENKFIESTPFPQMTLINEEVSHTSGFFGQSLGLLWNLDNKLKLLCNRVIFLCLLNVTFILKQKFDYVSFVQIG